MPRHALARQFDQKQTISLADIRDLQAPFVDLAPMHDNVFGWAAGSSNGHHGFQRDGAVSSALKFYPHRVPPCASCETLGSAHQLAAPRRRRLFRGSNSRSNWIETLTKK